MESAKEIKGSVKETVGKVVGDAKLQSDGRADKVEGKVQNALGGVKDAVRERKNERGAARHAPTRVRTTNLGKDIIKNAMILAECGNDQHRSSLRRRRSAGHAPDGRARQS